MSAPLLSVHEISKRFPGVVALDRVELEIRPGEVLAIIGENGAGKSTLMKILAGVHAPDSGEVRLRNEAVVFHDVQAALRHGIALIHQELNLADNLDVTANLFLGREKTRRGLLQSRDMEREARQHLQRVGLPISPHKRVGALSIGHQQLVEIAKALACKAQLLIMDEPTSSLSLLESQRLFQVVREMRSEGVSIVYITHRLGEVVELADRVEVLRDGRNVGCLQRDEIGRESMIRLMVGRDIDPLFQRPARDRGERLLEVQGLRTRAHPQQALSFAVHRGEVVGLAGLVGAGRTEVLETLFGVCPWIDGEIQLDGTPLGKPSPPAAIRHGMMLVPEDRRQHGLVLEMSLQDNLTLTQPAAARRLGLRQRHREKSIAADLLQQLRIAAASPEQPAAQLSGGNQQKVVLGKWLALQPRLLLLDEPTRGVDVGSKEEIYQMIDELARRGVALLFASSEMEEILALADRVLVMHEGRFSGELARAQLSEEAVLQLATGQGSS